MEPSDGAAPDEQLARLAEQLRVWRHDAPRGPDGLDDLTLADYVTGELADSRRAEIDAKLAASPELAEIISVVRETLHESGWQGDSASPPLELRPPAALATPAPRPTQVSSPPEDTSRPSPWLTRWPLAAAAVLLLAIGIGWRLTTRSRVAEQATAPAPAKSEPAVRPETYSARHLGAPRKPSSSNAAWPKTSSRASVPQHVEPRAGLRAPTRKGLGERAEMLARKDAAAAREELKWLVARIESQPPPARLRRGSAGQTPAPTPAAPRRELVLAYRDLERSLSEVQRVLRRARVAYALQPQGSGRFVIEATVDEDLAAGLLARLAAAVARPGKARDPRLLGRPAEEAPTPREAASKGPPKRKVHLVVRCCPAQAPGAARKK